MRNLVTFMLWLLALSALPAAAQQATQTPTQFYMEYRDAWAKAKSLDPILPYFASDSRTEFDATPPDRRQMMFQMMKVMGNMTDVKVVKETRQPDGFMLDLTAIGPDGKPVTGTARIIMEGGAMKLKKESWTS